MIVWQKPDPRAPRDLTKHDHRVTISFVMQESTYQEALWKAEQKRRQLKKGRRRAKRAWDEALGRYVMFYPPVIEPVIDSVEVISE